MVFKEQKKNQTSSKTKRNAAYNQKVISIRSHPLSYVVTPTVGHAGESFRVPRRPHRPPTADVRINVSCSYVFSTECSFAEVRCTCSRRRRSPWWWDSSVLVNVRLVNSFYVDLLKTVETALLQSSTKWCMPEKPIFNINYNDTRGIKAPFNTFFSKNTTRNTIVIHDNPEQLEFSSNVVYFLFFLRNTKCVYLINVLHVSTYFYCYLIIIFCSYRFLNVFLRMSWESRVCTTVFINISDHIFPLFSGKYNGTLNDKSV